MAMLNPKDFDSKGGPSGTVEEVVAVAGDLSGHDLSVKFPKVLLGGGRLPSSDRSREGVESLESMQISCL